MFRFEFLRFDFIVVSVKFEEGANVFFVNVKKIVFLFLNLSYDIFVKIWFIFLCFLIKILMNWFVFNINLIFFYSYIIRLLIFSINFKNLISMNHIFFSIFLPIFSFIIILHYSFHYISFIIIHYPYFTFLSYFHFISVNLLSFQSTSFSISKFHRFNSLSSYFISIFISSNSQPLLFFFLIYLIIHTLPHINLLNFYYLKL